MRPSPLQLTTQVHTRAWAGTAGASHLQVHQRVLQVAVHSVVRRQICEAIASSCTQIHPRTHRRVTPARMAVQADATKPTTTTDKLGTDYAYR